MRVFFGFDNLARFTHPVVTVGSYDGVHAGHRELLGRINRLATEKGGESVVITFSPHPRQVIDGGCGVMLLNSLDEKIRLLEQAGVANLIVAPFTEEFRRVSSHDFIRKYLIDRVGVSTLIVGYNHHFGHNREGNYEYLDRLRSEFGFDVLMLPKQEVDNHKVSSTVVREMIESGRMALAAEYLGYPYFICGRVTAGGDLVSPEPCKLLPPDGEYNVDVTVGAESYRAALRIGGGKMTLCGVDGAEGEVTVVFASRQK